MYIFLFLRAQPQTKWAQSTRMLLKPQIQNKWRERQLYLLTVSCEIAKSQLTNSSVWIYLRVSVCCCVYVLCSPAPLWWVNTEFVCWWGMGYSLDETSSWITLPSVIVATSKPCVFSVIKKLCPEGAWGHSAWIMCPVSGSRCKGYYTTAASVFALAPPRLDMIWGQNSFFLNGGLVQLTCVRTSEMLPSYHDRWTSVRREGKGLSMALHGPTTRCLL